MELCAEDMLIVRMGMPEIGQPEDPNKVQQCSRLHPNYHPNYLSTRDRGLGAEMAVWDCNKHFEARIEFRRVVQDQSLFCFARDKMPALA